MKSYLQIPRLEKSHRELREMRKSMDALHDLVASEIERRKQAAELKKWKEVFISATCLKLHLLLYLVAQFPLKTKFSTNAEIL